MADWAKLLIGDPAWNKVVDSSVGISDSIGGEKPREPLNLLEFAASQEGLTAGQAWSQGALTLDEITADEEEDAEDLLPDEELETELPN